MHEHHSQGIATVLTGIFSSSNALQAFQTSLDTTANNLANSATNAFKGRRVLFHDLGYTDPLKGQIGLGSGIASIDRNFAQGKTSETGRELDVMIQGDGFFAVTTASGSTQYTRDGSFHLNALGQLVNASELPLQPPMTFPADVISTQIDSDGTVSVLTGDSPDVPIVVGQLRLTNFINPQGLRAVGGNRFAETDSSGVPLTNVPGTSGLGTLVQDHLESSNVETSTEMVALVNTSRDYVANSRALKVEDQILQGALDLVG